MIWQTTGAQLLSLNSPLFYLSPHLNPDAPARGGVPVLFPQFADKGPLQKHGYARNMPWTLDKDEKNENTHLAQFSLDVSKTTWPTWPYAARLELKIEHRFGPNAKVDQATLNESLDMTLQITNTGDQPFEFTGGLHPYFAIENPVQFKLNGLAGCPIVDKLDPALRYESTTDSATGPISGQTRGPVINGTEIERLYLKAMPVSIEGSSLGTLSLSTTGFTNWMVWNPGVELAKTIADLPDGDWASFVCVEPVIADHPLRLNLGQTFNGSLRVEW
jgi:glucose-6-phosphate 1-epimerase